MLLLLLLLILCIFATFYSRLDLVQLQRLGLGMIVGYRFIVDL